MCRVPPRASAGPPIHLAGGSTLSAIVSRRKVPHGGIIAPRLGGVNHNWAVGQSRPTARKSPLSHVDGGFEADPPYLGQRGHKPVVPAEAGIQLSRLLTDVFVSTHSVKEEQVRSGVVCCAPNSWTRLTCLHYRHRTAEPPGGSVLRSRALAEPPGGSALPYLPLDTLVTQKTRTIRIS